MKIQSLLVLAMAGSAVASSPVLREGSDISADSKLGGRILSKARRVNNDNNDDQDVTWVANFSLKFKRCHSFPMFGVEGARENEGGMGMQNLIRFQLCPTGSCGSCSGGAEYIVEMREFVESYMEAKQEAAERVCEKAKESCEYYCQNQDDANDDQVCLNTCLSNNGNSDCIEDDDNNNNNEDDMREFNECKEAGFGDNNNYNNNNNNNNNNNGYFIGPYCARGGKAIHLGLFEEEGCMTRVNNNKYYEYYGTSLPYASENMISNDCVSCLEEQDEDENNNNYYYKEPSELCTELHEQAGKCEKRLKDIGDFPYYTPNTDACSWMHKTLPALEKTANSNGAAVRWPTALAWIFGISTLGLGGLSYYMYTKAQRMNVNLLGDDEKTTTSDGVIA